MPFRILFIFEHATTIFVNGAAVFILSQQQPAILCQLPAAAAEAGSVSTKPDK
jgi:hypothetical protein